jgi:hypothetical protein
VCPQASKDAQEGLNSTLDSISSMGSQDEDTLYRDPTDPTKVRLGWFETVAVVAVPLAELYTQHKHLGDK